MTIARNARISSPSHTPMDKCYIDYVWKSTIFDKIRKIFRHLLVEQVEGELKPDRLHVGPLERRGDIHVHVEEPERFGFAFCLLHIFVVCLLHLLIAPPCSACSISSCERSLTNHSKLFWSRLIQKKSTWDREGQGFNCW